MSAVARALPADAPYDIARVRADFPILAERVHGKPLVYLDNGASAQKPRQVLDAMANAYAHSYANVHRGVHTLSQRATELYENARARVAAFLGAPSPDCIVFTKNATESFNLVAHSFGQTLAAGDEIIVSAMEHHANIVPWQLLGQRAGTVLKVAPIGDDGSFDLDAFARLLGPRTRLVSVTHCSNVLGTVTPAREIVRLAHAAGAKVMFDGAQAAVHRRVDVAALDCDFYALTGHKLYGPTGIGVLYGKTALLDALPPFLGGGDMIESVSFAGTTFRAAPARFEAGTPPIVEAVGLAAAIEYVDALGLDAIGRHEHGLLASATRRLAAVPGLTLFGTAPEKAAIVSFTLDGVHPHDAGTVLDQLGVAVRVGHHCAEPLMARLGIAATLRASLALYNTEAEIDALVAGLDVVRDLLGGAR